MFKEGSIYVGLEEGFILVFDVDVVVEVYVKRFVEYDRNFVVCITVIDD